VANTHLSVDPYMRGRMNDTESYVPPFGLGETMTGGAIGRVVESAVGELPVGTTVLHFEGWRDLTQGPAASYRAVPVPDGVGVSAYLGILGGTGLTAYVGLTTIAPVRTGDVVFVSGAAGAVGSAAGQIARLLGAGRVVGSAGRPDKVAALTARYGYDAAFDYHSGPAADRLAEVAPDGIDVYFDNVGGEQLEAAIGALRQHGRAALCGSISAYNATEPPPGPRTMSRVVTHSLTLRGFIVSNFGDQQPEFVERMTGWLRSGEVVYDETVVHGIGSALDAFFDLLRGGNLGKMVVEV
jgi:NADPH-dependent curcumin reductase CurA